LEGGISKAVQADLPQYKVVFGPLCSYKFEVAGSYLTGNRIQLLTVQKPVKGVFPQVDPIGIVRAGIQMDSIRSPGVASILEGGSPDPYLGKQVFSTHVDGYVMRIA